MWIDNATDQGVAFVLWLAVATIAIGLVGSWALRRNNRCRIARYEAWVEQRTPATSADGAGPFDVLWRLAHRSGRERTKERTRPHVRPFFGDLPTDAVAREPKNGWAAPSTVLWRASPAGGRERTKERRGKRRG